MPLLRGRGRPRPIPATFLFLLLVSLSALRLPAGDPVAALETPLLRFELSPEDGHYEITDRAGNVTWRSNPYQPRFGEVTVMVEGKRRQLPLTRSGVRRLGQTRLATNLEATFHPLAEKPEAALRVVIRALAGDQALEFAYDADAALGVESVRLLDDALWVNDSEKGYAVVPVREGLLVPADSGLAFTHRFGTYEYEGCHMEMLGLVKSGAAALITWHDPYLTVDLKSALPKIDAIPARQILSTTLTLRQSAKSFRIQFLGTGDAVAIARAYRLVAKERGWLVTWSDKLPGHPERSKLFGAANVKLWSTLDREMNEESSKEMVSRVNWTFDEAAQVAEHLKNDLKLDRVFFLMGGWIHRGYDNQHPDILPTAPECGGDAAFMDCARRIRATGYLLGLHDNYQDMYRDAPSWDETFLTKNPDGSIMRGGKWAGGRAFVTCSQKALELAKRPQNLVAVKKLSQADAYFIDTTYAAGLMECFDKNHPLTRWDDIKWKQALSDYGRDIFGIFGSECGREWAIPHSEFFEGLTGVSGSYYHDVGLPGKLGATVVPLFEMVYRDCIAMYGKYGYDPAKAAEYVLHHISIGRPLNYHSLPVHLYWKEKAWDGRPLPLRPAVAEFKQSGPRQFSITYRWSVGGPVPFDWPVFVHFTDRDGKILFQGDYAAQPPMVEWKAGEMLQGPRQVSVPPGLEGVFDIRLGMYNRKNSGSRPALLGRSDGEHRYLLGQVKVKGDQVEYVPGDSAPAREPSDPGLFMRADGGWADGMHHWDRFLKNTYEILSPLNELTAEVPLTRHQFLTADRTVRRTVFGDGAEAMQAVVNFGNQEYRHTSLHGMEVVLPAYGFLVESPTFVAFLALSWGGSRYETAPLFTLRSLDGKPLSQAGKIRVYHGFGDARLRWQGKLETVAKERVISR